MTDIHELLISLGSGLLLLILMSGFIGSDFVYMEVPMMGRVPLGLFIPVSLALYGAFGLIFLGLGQAIAEEFSLNYGIRLILCAFATLTSYYLGKILMGMFQETPHIPLCDRPIGLTATIRYQPKSLKINRPGDALVYDRQEKITQIVTVYLPDWAVEKNLKKDDLVRLIDYLPNKNAFLVVKAGGVDEFYWQN